LRKYVSGSNILKGIILSAENRISPSKDQQAEQVLLGQQTGKYTDELFDSIQGLIASVARRHQRDTVPLDDFIQEANLKVLEALAHYRKERGAVSTFVSKVTNDAMHEAVAEYAYPVRLTSHTLTKKNRLIREAEKQTQLTHQVPTIYEIAKNQYRPCHTKNMLMSTSQASSLNQPLMGSDSRDDLIDSLPATDSLRPTEDEALANCLSSYLYILARDFCTNEQIEALDLFIQGYDAKDSSNILSERYGAPFTRQAVESRLNKAFNNLRKHFSDY
jgi:RNA polymerase sigma factor (sigma-70 family)